jgi:hypothetical protein
MEKKQQSKNPNTQQEKRPGQGFPKQNQTPNKSNTGNKSSNTTSR